MGVEIDHVKKQHGASQGDTTAQQAHQVAQALIEEQQKDSSEDPDLQGGAGGIEIHVFVAHLARAFILTCNNNINNNNNNNRTERRYSRFLTISSQRRELSPTHTLKWPRCNRVQIMCNTSRAYHVQVSCYVPLGTKGQLSY